MVKKQSEIWSWVRAFLIAIVLVFVVRTFLFEPVVVKGASMEPTLEEKDYMIVTKIGEPKRFDIVVFHAHENEDYVKRVIGLPGDKIEYKDDTLYVNGKLYEEPFLEEFKKEVINGPLTNSFTIDEVPEGHVFVLGDNRRNSEDSRQIGPISMEKIVGKAKFVLFPLDKIHIVD